MLKNKIEKKCYYLMHFYDFILDGKLISFRSSRKTNSKNQLISHQKERNLKLLNWRILRTYVAL